MNVIWTKFNHMVDGSKATASVSSSQHAERRQTYGCYLAKFNHMVDGSKATASVSSSQHAERRQTYECYLDQVQPHGRRF